jgi:hypothetical protein
MRRLRRTVRRSGGTLVKCPGYANDRQAETGHTDTYDDEHNKSGMCMACSLEKANIDSLAVKKWDEEKAERVEREKAQREAERVEREKAQREAERVKREAGEKAKREADKKAKDEEAKSLELWAQPPSID